MSSAAGSALSRAQLRLLRRLVADAEPVVARRAGIVLAEHRRRAGRARRGPGAPAGPGGQEGPAGVGAVPVARQTAAKWYLRFVGNGADGLHDLPRSGRPAGHGDDATRAVLVAPLFMASVRWTSHDVAELTGQSQTAVVRAWRQAYESPAPLAPRLPESGLAIVAAYVEPGDSAIVLAARTAPVPSGSTGPFMRSPRRAPLQVLLAADLLVADRSESDRSGSDRSGSDRSRRDEAVGATAVDGSARPVQAFVESVRRTAGTRASLFVLSRRPPADRHDAVAGVEYLVVPTAPDWQALLGTLVRRCTATPPQVLVGLQQQLMAWAQGPVEPFAWQADVTDAQRPDRPAGTPIAARIAAPRPTGQVMADEVLAAILGRIAAGRLTAGDRVTESSLSRDVHASRGHVREALLTLASNGLVDLEQHRGARVPAPQVADVLETYAVRRALGSLLVRRAVHRPPAAMAAARDALTTLTTVARTGDAWATGDADIRFQDALALCTGMRRIPRMFIALSDQIRLFTAVMGVRYTYSVPEMVRDDTSLLECLQARDEAAALRVWQAKMDDALTYMVTQLGSPVGAPRR